MQATSGHHQRNGIPAGGTPKGIFRELKRKGRTHVPNGMQWLSGCVIIGRNYSMKNKKYTLLKDDTVTYFGHTLYRIKATIDFGDVEKGELGGYIEKEENLSHFDNAWVSDNALVSDNARVTGDAEVSDNARVTDNAWVTDNALVSGDARVTDNARVTGDAKVTELGDAITFKNHWSSGRYFTYTKSNKMWKVGCFYGTGKELIAKAYKDSEISGKHYESYVNLVSELEKIDG